jgi:hypothetical protein
MTEDIDLRKILNIFKKFICFLFYNVKQCSGNSCKRVFILDLWWKWTTQAEYVKFSRERVRKHNFPYTGWSKYLYAPDD